MLRPQKKTYFLLAYAQKVINIVCGTKLMINNAEVSLTAEEAKTYRNTYKTQLDAKYNSKNGYKNLQVELFYPGTVVIYYEGERKYEQARDQWDCTSTWYGFVKATDNLSADNQLAKLQAENRKVNYSNVKRWGTPQMQSDKTDDLEVRWVQTKTGVTAFITNTRKDAALKVTIKSFKNTSATQNLALEGNFDKAKKLEEHTSVLQPGERWQLRLENADGFEVETAPAKVIKEEKGIINTIQNRINLYIRRPSGVITPSSAVGKRG